jgi:plasmid stabilization system protein ParE
LKYRIRVTARAMGDADAASRWIAEHRSPARAERWYQGLFARIEALTSQPLRCPVIAERRRFPEELRELLYGKRNKKYRIIFTICGSDVVILYIHHGARGEWRPGEDPRRWIAPRSGRKNEPHPLRFR